MERVEDLKALGRRWWVLAIVGLVGAGIGLAITPASSHRQPKAAFVGQLFRGTHTIQLTGAGSSRASSTMTNAQLLLQTDVQQRLAASLGAQALQGVALSSTADNMVGTLAVTAVANDGARAVRVADAAAAELINAVNEQAVATNKGDVAHLNSDIAKLTTQINELSPKIEAEDARNPAQHASIVDRALQGALTSRLSADFSQLLTESDPPTIFQDQTPAIAVPVAVSGSKSSSSPTSSRSVKVLIGLLIGVALAAAGVVTLDRFDTRIRTRVAAESALGLPVLAEIPVVAREWRRPDWLPVHDDRLSAVAEGYRALRTGVTLAPPGEQAKWNGQGPGVVLIVSPSSGEGRSSVTANLAAAFAETFSRVVAVNGDVRRPQLPNLLGVHSPGDVSRSADEPWAPAATRVPGVFVLPGDSVDARPSGGLSWLHELIRAGRPSADVMLIDTPSLLMFHDAEELLPAADAVVLVCRAGQTTVDAASRTIEQLTRLGGTVLGVCLVGVPQSRARRRATRQYTLAPAADQLPADQAPTEGTTPQGPESSPPTAGVPHVHERPVAIPGPNGRDVPAKTGASTSDVVAAPTTPIKQPNIEDRGEKGWRRDDRVLWRPVVGGVLLLLPGAAEPVAASESAGRLWEALVAPPGGPVRVADEAIGRSAGMTAIQFDAALAELIDLGVLVQV